MKNIQGLVPIILSISFVSIISYATYGRLDTINDIYIYWNTIIFASLYLLWLLLESKIATKEIAQSKTEIDEYSLELYALSRATLVIVGLVTTPTVKNFDITHIVGLFVFVAGISFRLIAIQILGSFYSHRVRLQNDHQIINNGPYSVVRHPAYTGMILAHLGFVLFFLNLWTLTIWAFFHIPAVIYRIIVEEKILYQLPGYLDYAKHKKRIFPYIW